MTDDQQTQIDMTSPHDDEVDDETDGWNHGIIAAAVPAVLSVAGFVGLLVADPTGGWSAVFFPGFFGLVGAMCLSWVFFWMAPKVKRNSGPGLLTSTLLTLISIPTGLVLTLILLLAGLMGRPNL